MARGARSVADRLLHALPRPARQQRRHETVQQGRNGPRGQLPALVGSRVSERVSPLSRTASTTSCLPSASQATWVTSHPSVRRRTSNRLASRASLAKSVPALTRGGSHSGSALVVAEGRAPRTFFFAGAALHATATAAMTASALARSGPLALGSATAHIDDATVTTTTGDVEVSAASEASITADTRIATSTSGVGASIGLAFNTVGWESQNLLWNTIESLYQGEDLDPAHTTQGSMLAVAKAGDFVTVETAAVTQADIAATNGVVHVVDTVLPAPAGK